MVKAAKPKKKAKPKYSDQKQSERFIETARQLGAETTEKFDEAVTMILKHRTIS